MLALASVVRFDVQSIGTLSVSDGTRDSGLGCCCCCCQTYCCYCCCRDIGTRGLSTDTRHSCPIDESAPTGEGRGLSNDAQDVEPGPLP
jgi:hypothetical protein